MAKVAAWVGAVVLGGGAGLALAQSEAEQASRPLVEDVVRELRQTNEQLRLLNERVESAMAAWERVLEEDNRRGPDYAALRKLTLPAQATAAEVEEYVQRIAVLTLKQDRYDDDDPQVAMLADAGRQHLEPLIAALGSSNTMDRYLFEALKVATKDSQKGVLIDQLARRPELLQVVQARRWTMDAKDVLIEEVRNGRQRGSPAWLTAVAQLGDESVFPLLEQCFVQGPNRLQVWRIVESLPGVDAEGAVRRAWQQAKLENPQERIQLATLAIGFGEKDALAILIEQLPPHQPPNPQMNHPGMWHHGGFGGPIDLRQTVLVHINFHGNNDEIRDWFRQNREKLRFDPATRRYYVASAIS